MKNKVIEDRLTGLLATLQTIGETTFLNSSAVKGAARATFVNNFLKQVIPTNLRICTNGEVTDISGNITGELDVIIENGLFPSLPLTNIDLGRLYFAEGVAAVIEVKSNLVSQWNEVMSTGHRLFDIRRQLAGGTYSSRNTSVLNVIPNMDVSADNLGRVEPTGPQKMQYQIPYIVVGYTGWDTIATIQNKIHESNGVVSAVLQIDKGFFASGELFSHIAATDGALSILSFLDSISEASSYIKNASANLLKYGE